MNSRWSHKIAQRACVTLPEICSPFPSFASLPTKYSLSFLLRLNIRRAYSYSSWLLSACTTSSCTSIPRLIHVPAPDGTPNRSSSFGATLCSQHQNFRNHSCRTRQGSQRCTSTTHLVKSTRVRQLWAVLCLDGTFQSPALAIAITIIRQSAQELLVTGISGAPITGDHCSQMVHRPHPASDVHVTGTFDDWGKTEKLEKVGDVFEKEVNLPSADEKYYYKVCALKLHKVSNTREFWGALQCQPPMPP